MDKNKNAQFRVALAYIKAKKRITISELSSYGGCSARHIQGVLSEKENKGAGRSVAMGIASGVGYTYDDMFSLGKWIIDGNDPELFQRTGTINQTEAHINIPSAEINAEPSVTSNTEINVHKGVMMTTKVLSSKTGYANALWHNLMAFDAAVEKEERVKELEKKVDLLLEKMERMERAVVTPGEVDKKREATG